MSFPEMRLFTGMWLSAKPAVNTYPAQLSESSGDCESKQRYFKFSAMPEIKQQRPDQMEESTSLAIDNDQHSDQPSIRASPEKHRVAAYTLQEWLKRRVSSELGYLRMQVLTDYEQNKLFGLNERLDGWGHPARRVVVKNIGRQFWPTVLKDQFLGKN